LTVENGKSADSAPPIESPELIRAKLRPPIYSIGDD
jgi:hypothetical protein